MRKFVGLAAVFMAFACAGAFVTTSVEDSVYDMYDQASYLTFDANGGTGEMPVKRVKDPKWVKLPACAFTRPGYVFNGWCAGCDDCEEGGDCWRRAGTKVWVNSDKTYRATWKKLWITHATNYCAYVKDASGDVAALVFVKVGAPGKKSGATSLSATVVQPRARKFTLRGRTDTGVAELSGRVSTLDLELTETSLKGVLDGYEVVGAPVPGDYSAEHAFSAEAPAAGLDTGAAWTSLPQQVPVSVVHSYWTTAPATRFTLVDGVPDPCGLTVNPWKVALKYNALTGRFSGRFTAYFGTEEGVNLAVGDACTVAGVMVNGRGWGYALSKSDRLYQVRVK